MSNDPPAKPERPKMVVVIKGEGIMTTEDQMDWRVEGTLANKRVEELSAKVDFWLWATIVFLVVFIASGVATAFDLDPSGQACHATMVASFIATLFCYVMTEVKMGQIKIWTDGE